MKNILIQQTKIIILARGNENTIKRTSRDFQSLKFCKNLYWLKSFMLRARLSYQNQCLHLKIHFKVIFAIRKALFSMLAFGSVIIDDFSQLRLEAVALHHPHFNASPWDLSILI